MRRSNDSNPNTSQSGIHFTNTFHKHRPTSLWKQTPVTHKTISNKLKYSNDYNTNPQCLKTPPVGEMPPWAPGPYHWLPHRQSATMELGKWPREKVPGRGVVHLQQFGLKTQQVGKFFDTWCVAEIHEIYMYIIWSVDPNQSPECCWGRTTERFFLKSYWLTQSMCPIFSLWRKKIHPACFGRQYFFHHFCCAKTFHRENSQSLYLLRSRVFSKLPLRCHQTCTSLEWDFIITKHPKEGGR